MTFNETGLSPKLLSAVEAMGFTEPTPIQVQTIPLILETTDDVLAIAQTGTGKTAAFGLPVIDRLDKNLSGIQSIILCPTRELCRQITKDMQAYSKFSERCKIVSVYGGASISDQIRDIKRGADIVVGTPGRVVDLINRKQLALDNIQFVVLDEADEMLNMGFKDDLDFILGATPDVRQTLLFSATMPKEVRRIAQRYMQNVHEIAVERGNLSAENIEHTYHVVSSSSRFETLRRIVDFNTDIYGIVFCRTRRETQQVSDSLIQCGYNADALHGDLSQAQRDSVMGRFRTKHLQILVATDVAARGIDVDDVTHVIHYNLPDDNEAYIHRSGRTARAGKSGSSIALVAGREKSKIKFLEKKIGKTMLRKPIPLGKDICIKQLYKVVDALDKTEVAEADIADFMPEIYERLSEYSKEEIIQRFVSTEFNKFFAHYKNAPDLNTVSNDRDQGSRRREDRNDRDRNRNSRDRDRGRGDRSDRSDRGRDRGRERETSFESDGDSRRGRSYSRYFINLGKKDDLNPNRLMGFINEQPGLEGVSIGRIEVLKTFAFFEVDKSCENVVSELQNKTFRSRTVMVERAESTGKQTSNAEGDFRKKKRKKEKHTPKRHRKGAQVIL